MNKYIYIMILSVLGMEGFAATEGTVEMPRLVVNISIDQLRAEDLQAFMPQYSEEGLRKLLSQGRIYTNVTHPYAPTDRASATATIQTGSTPHYHGIISGEWMDRNTLRPTRCTREEGKSDATSKHLMASTIGDEMKVETYGGALVYAIAVEEDAAMLSAGHSGDGAIWYDRNKNRWQTSAYHTSLTMPWLDTWNRSYQNQKKIIYSSDNTLINNDITELALLCQNVNGMGLDGTADYLSLQYVTDGTEEGYRNLDGALGKLITTFEQRLGRDHLLFIVTPTSHCDDKDYDVEKYRIPTGTFYINRTAGYLNMYLAAIYGTGSYVETYYDNSIYLNRSTLDRKHLRLTEVLEHCKEMLLMSEGVQEVYTAPLFADGNNEYAKLLREGYHRKVSGDLMIEVMPGWKVLNEDTNTYQKQPTAGIAFPVIFYGGSIEAQTVNTAVTTTQIAPTICKTIRIRAPNACKSTPLY